MTILPNPKKPLNHSYLSLRAHGHKHRHTYPLTYIIIAVIINRITILIIIIDVLALYHSSERGWARCGRKSCVAGNQAPILVATLALTTPPVRYNTMKCNELNEINNPC